MTQLNAENWKRFTPDSYETGEPEAVRWASRLVMNDPDWSKWHATDGSGAFTACGQLVRPFLVDGSPQHKDAKAVNCRRCLAVMKRASEAAQ